MKQLLATAKQRSIVVTSRFLASAHFVTDTALRLPFYDL